MWQVGVEVVKKKITGRDHLEKKCRLLQGVEPAHKERTLSKQDLGTSSQSEEVALDLVGNQEPLKKHFFKYQAFF